MAEAIAHAFRGGKLMIWREDELMEIHGWPDPWARRKVARAAWERFDPAFPLVVPYRPSRRKKGSCGTQMQLSLGDTPVKSRAEERRRAFAGFRFSLPKDVARRLEPFRSLQWRLLVGCALSDCFVELLGSNPVLAYFWAGRMAACPRDGRVFDVAGTMPQRALAEELMLPGSKSGVKLMRKVFVPALSRMTAPNLQRLLCNEETRMRCQHLPRINTGIINLLAQPGLASWTAPNLLNEVAEAKDELFRSPTAERLEDHRRLWRQLGDERLRTFTSREELREDHQRIVARYHDREREREAARREELARLARIARDPEAQRREREARAAARLREPFPEPPVPGMQTIEPLRDEAALRQEGRAQHNCVGTYANRVRAGSHYIYRVTWPERATLSLVRGEAGTWLRGQCEIAHNRAAGAKTVQLVDQWLQDQQAIPGAGAGATA
ncbi:MAG: hypothetical protein HKN82_18705 [Akkermansiaceae bacterium]|nr:hypothetical protein [Akkermansiaceae bacterium]NNM30996.1 hypothetical protein [Akkermansiaceae bacterium]